MAAPVTIFQHGEPRQRLMAWFLKDSAIDAVIVESLDDAVVAIKAPETRVTIVNTTACNAEVAALVKTLRSASSNVRIIVLHAGHHVASDPEIAADACVHDVSDPDALVATVRAALEDDLAPMEPHAAAEEAAG